MDISLRKKKDAAQLVISGAENTRFFGDTFRLYAQNESTLRLCGPAFQKKLLPLLGRQATHPDGKPISMKMGLGDIPTFCSCVLPQIEGLATVEDPSGLMDKYSPEECTPCFYLDLDGDGCLTLELRFRYGEREVHSSAASEEWGQVYKLIAKDTIEEQILDLQDKKAALMDALSGTTEAGILEMSKEELLELLKIG